MSFSVAQTMQEIEDYGRWIMPTLDLDETLFIGRNAAESDPMGNYVYFIACARYPDTFKIGYSSDYAQRLINLRWRYRATTWLHAAVQLPNASEGEFALQMFFDFAKAPAELPDHGMSYEFFQAKPVLEYLAVVAEQRGKAVPQSWREGKIDYRPELDRQFYAIYPRVIGRSKASLYRHRQQAIEQANDREEI